MIHQISGGHTARRIQIADHLLTSAHSLIYWRREAINVHGSLLPVFCTAQHDFGGQKTKIDLLSLAHTVLLPLFL
jgi:hypothetical protein